MRGGVVVVVVVVEQTRSKSQHKKLTLEKKNRPSISPTCNVESPTLKASLRAALGEKCDGKVEAEVIMRA